MNEIFVANGALASYLTISALFGDVRCKRFRWRLKGARKRSIRSKAKLAKLAKLARVRPDGTGGGSW